MITILCGHSPRTGHPLYSIRPYKITEDTIGEEPVRMYFVSRFYQPFLSNIIKHLQKQHPTLLFSKELNQQEESPSPLFYQRIRQILPLIPAKKRVAVLCEQEDARLPVLIKAISPFAHAVSLVSENTAYFEIISEEALSDSGLSINRRSLPELGTVDLTLLLSGVFDLSYLHAGYLINLSPQKVTASVPSLVAISNPQIDSFLRQYPYLKLNPTLLISPDAPITNLIWKN